MRGEDIRYLRTEILKFNAKTFSKEIGVSFVTLSLWENGKTHPNPLARDKIIRLYGHLYPKLLLRDTSSPKPIARNYPERQCILNLKIEPFRQKSLF